MMSRENAETLALRALSWLVGNEDLLGVFMGASGVSREDLSAGASDPVFLTGVLEFICMDDDWIGQFAEDAGCAMTAPYEAKQVLAGPDVDQDIML